MNKVCIIGGGASGLMAALFAAKNGARVTVYEGNPEPLKKLLRTGNGKCNLSNLNMSSEYFNSDAQDFVNQCFNKISPKDLLFYFSQIGLLIKEKNNYLYPYSEQSKSVKDVLLGEAESLFITIESNSYVNCIAKDETGFLISVEGKKERFHFDKVILATGGKAGLLKKDRQNGYDLLKSLNVKITDLYPGLTKLICSEKWLKNLDGIRHEVDISLLCNGDLIKKEHGEILFRENGISGICVFILSSFCKKLLKENKNVTVSIDMFPEISTDELNTFTETRYLLNSDKALSTFFKGIFPDGINEEIINSYNLTGNKRVSDYSVDLLKSIFNNLKSISLTVIDTADFENAQVTVGGVDISCLNDHLEVKSVPGLYVVGELVNVDGPCGGYNLHWAFTSGAIAGENSCYS